MQNISQGKPLLYNVVHLMRLDIKRCQFKSDKRPWFCLLHVKEIVACLLGVKQTSPTDKGYAMFPFQKTTQPRQTNNLQLKETHVLDG